MKKGLIIFIFQNYEINILMIVKQIQSIRLNNGKIKNKIYHKEMKKENNKQQQKIIDMENI